MIAVSSLFRCAQEAEARAQLAVMQFVSFIYAYPQGGAGHADLAGLWPIFEKRIR